MQIKKPINMPNWFVLIYKISGSMRERKILQVDLIMDDAFSILMQ